MKASKVLFLVILITASLCIVATQPVKVANATIHSDGSFDPSTVPIRRVGNVYTLTGDITGGLTVRISNIIIDGNGHTMHTVSLTLSGEGEKIQNVTIKNIIFQNCSIFLNYCDFITITGNTIMNCWNDAPLHPLEEGVGITVWGGAYNTIVGNTISNNQNGIVISGAPSTLIYHNNFINNTVDVSPEKNPFVSLGDESAIFDNGKEGNYWSSYAGTDADADGIGDTPHIINDNNQDRYPLMSPITPYVIDVTPDVPPLDTTPPAVSIGSPENKTYATGDVPLTFTLSEPSSWIGYSLNGQANVTLAGNMTLIGLLEGAHSLRVYANDTVGNMGSSETVHFTISHETKPPEPFPTTWIAAATVTAAIVAGAGCIVYFAKLKKKSVKK